MMTDRRRDWVLVCGGFHVRGGMDRANASLAAYLAERGERVHLVAHHVDPCWLTGGRAQVSIVPRPAGSFIIGELALERRGRRTASALRRAGRPPVVVANGGNLAGADLNWVHYVHHAYGGADEGAPAWFRIRNRAVRSWARGRERRAIQSARVVVTNSRRTTHDVVQRVGVPASRVHTVYLGSERDWVPPSETARRAARERWCGGRGASPLVAFVGALGYEARKGIDLLLDAWAQLRAAGWTASLVVAGPGRTDVWERRARGLGGSVRFVGHIDDVGTLLDAADVLVSPVRYEAYGLAAHEAICRGVPVIITATAGVAERLSADLEDLLLPDPPTAGTVAERLRRWAERPERWRLCLEPVSAALRAYQDREMAARVVDIAASVSA